jgi:hypothetical protein
MNNMTEKYYMIRNSDGETFVTEHTNEELLKIITPDKNGYTDLGDSIKFLDSLVDNDTNYLGENNLLIIKGQIVTPLPIQITTKFDI